MRMKELWHWIKKIARDVFSLSKLRPQSTAWYEFFIMRVIFSLVLLDELTVIRLKLPFPKLGSGNIPSLPEQPFPVGIANIFDLTALSDPAVFGVVKCILIICLVIYVSGFALPVVLPIITAVHISVFTLLGSQGATHHIHQIGSLILLAQTIVVWWPREKGFSKLRQLTPKWRSLIVFHSMVAITGCYVLSAITKIIRTNGMWVWNSPYISMGMYKSNEQRYYNYIDPTDRKADYEVVAQFMFDHPFVTRFVLGGGFFIELFAFMALRSRSWSLAFGLGLMGMHVMVGRFMGLQFRQNEFLVMTFLVNIPFWITACGIWLNRNRTSL